MQTRAEIVYLYYNAMFVVQAVYSLLYSVQ